MRKYCDSLTAYARAATRPVAVGSVVIGGGNPVRIQSMTNTDTNDTEASAAQVRRIAGAGGEIVRLTAQGRREAANLAAIRARLREEGCSVPLVADIHFVPEAALVAAEHVEKVRINPGNFNDRGSQFDRLVALCREHGTALRIGVNHGSLSAAVMERYGDTPEGMVASAVEYLGLCRERGFDPVVVSLKSSNVRVMVQAYRLLAAEMRERGWDYPLHLGVTEAGDDMEGRIKSAVGIGALLADGLGDTIRVSLTEAPEREIPVARQLADYFAAREGHAPIPAVDESFYSPYEYRRRRSELVEGVGGDRPPVIWSELPEALRGKVFYADIHSVGEVPDGRIVVLTTANGNGVAEQRAFFLKMIEKGKTNPVVIRRTYDERDAEALQVKAAADLGPLLLAGGVAGEGRRRHGHVVFGRLRRRALDRKRNACRRRTLCRRRPEWCRNDIRRWRSAGRGCDVRCGRMQWKRAGRADGGSRNAGSRGGRYDYPGADRRAEPRDPAGGPRAHLEGRIHRLPELRTDALRPAGDARGDQGAHGAPGRGENRRDGLHRQRSR